MPLFGKNKPSKGLPESAPNEITVKKEGTHKTKSDGFSQISGSTGSSAASAKSRARATARNKNVLMGRGIFVLVLVVVAAVLGWLVYFLLDQSEQDLWEQQYESMVYRALQVTQSLAVSSFKDYQSHLTLYFCHIEYFFSRTISILFSHTTRHDVMYIFFLMML